MPQGPGLLTTDVALPLPMHPLRRDGLTREQASRRALVWIAVGLIHALFLSIFLISEQFPFLFRRPGAETILMLQQQPGSSPAPPLPQLSQPLPLRGLPEVVPAPITILPPPMPSIDGAPPATQGDVLNAIGQELGCSANSFEHLTAVERMRCRRVPWHGVRLPNGIIVLDAPRIFPQFQAPQPERMTGADARRQEMNRTPDCPIVLNLPCMNGFMHRNN